MHPVLSRADYNLLVLFITVTLPVASGTCIVALAEEIVSGNVWTSTLHIQKVYQVYHMVFLCFFSLSV